MCRAAYRSEYDHTNGVTVQWKWITMPYPIHDALMAALRRLYGYTHAIDLHTFCACADKAYATVGPRCVVIRFEDKRPDWLHLIPECKRDQIKPVFRITEIREY